MIASSSSAVDLRQAWYAVGLLNLVYLVGFVDRTILALLMPALQTDIGLSDTQLGLLSGVAFGLWYSFLGLPAGYLADRTNRRNLLAAGLLVWTFATMGSGLVGSFAGLFLMRMLVGTGEAVLHPTAASLIGDYFAPRTRPWALGAYLMAGAAGSTVAFLVGGSLLHAIGAEPVNWAILGQIAPWQAAFILVGAPGLLLAAVMLATMPEPTRQLGKGSASEGESWGAFLIFLKRNRITVTCHALGAPLMLVAAIGIMSWLPVHFLRTYGWQPQQTSVAYALTGGLANIAGALMAGWLPSILRRMGYQDATLRATLVSGVWLTGFACLGLIARDPYWAMGLIAVSSFAALVPAITSLAAVAELAPNRMRARLAAVYSIAVGVIPNSIAPFLIGWSTEHLFRRPEAIGLSMLLVIGVSGLIGTALLALGLKPYRRSLDAMNEAQHI